MVELYDKIDKAWHTPVASESILGSPFSTRPLSDFSKKVKSTDTFEDEWSELEKKAIAYDGLEDRKGAKAFYPPDSCAAQQTLVLALEHNAVPQALTERWYNSGDPTSKVEVFAREGSAAAKPGPKEFGVGEAVPPCGTCEVVLTMLMCPKDKAEAEDASKGVCSCNP